MLYPRLTDCAECGNVQTLLEDINCKLKELAINLYNNNVFLLNLIIPSEEITDLLNYKRILTYRLCNSDYASEFTIQNITSRVKLLIYK